HEIRLELKEYALAKDAGAELPRFGSRFFAPARQPEIHRFDHLCRAELDRRSYVFVKRAHVVFPRAALEHFFRSAGEFFYGMLRLLPQDAEKVVEEDRDVFASRIQGRKMDGRFGEPF